MWALKRRVRLSTRCRREEREQSTAATGVSRLRKISTETVSNIQYRYASKNLYFYVYLICITQIGNTHRNSCSKNNKVRVGTVGSCTHGTALWRFA